MSNRDASPRQDTRKASEVIAALANEHPTGRITFREIVDRLGDRTYGLLILTFALPMCTPASSIPGVSTLFGVPLIFITAQLALGLRQPRFPAYLLARSIDARDFKRVIERIVPIIVRAESYLRPRYGALTSPAAERVIGMTALLMAFILSLPIAFANGPPAFAMSFFALAILERDGLFVIFGAITSLISLAIAVAVLTGLAAAILYAIRAIL